MFVCYAIYNNPSHFTRVLLNQSIQNIVESLFINHNVNGIGYKTIRVQDMHSQNQFSTTRVKRFPVIKPGWGDFHCSLSDYTLGKSKSLLCTRACFTVRAYRREFSDTKNKVDIGDMLWSILL